jgi:hypothetical protein
VALPVSDTSSHTLIVNRDCRSVADWAPRLRLPLWLIAALEEKHGADAR